MTRTETRSSSNRLRDAVLSGPWPSLGWKMLANQMGRYYPARDHVYLCPAPDSFLWSKKRTEIKTILQYLNIVILHGMVHWAGEEHVDDDGGWRWNLSIEQIVVEKRMQAKTRPST